VSFEDRKAVATALKDIYHTVDAKTAEQAQNAFEVGVWGQKYTAITQSCRRAWQEVIPFFCISPARFAVSGASTPHGRPVSGS
jgi:transposase-like protein